jgi:hypothetical protein
MRIKMTGKRFHGSIKPQSKIMAAPRCKLVGYTNVAMANRKIISWLWNGIKRQRLLAIRKVNIILDYSIFLDMVFRAIINKLSIGT